jgi:hypothetical protein
VLTPTCEVSRSRYIPHLLPPARQIPRPIELQAQWGAVAMASLPWRPTSPEFQRP